MRDPQTCRTLPSRGISGRIPQDWGRPGASVVIADHILSRVTDGSIILLHDGGIDRSQTVAALEEVLVELDARGYDFGRLCA